MKDSQVEKFWTAKKSDLKEVEKKGKKEVLSLKITQQYWCY